MITLSADDADDVVQDVFIGLPEALHSYRERGRFGAWLRVVAARTALMRCRDSRRRTELTPEAASSGDGSRALVERDRARGRPRGFAGRHARQCSCSSVIEGYSHDEIAHQLGIRRGTAEVRHFRAIRRLRSLLETD